ncbi:MAG: polyprenyl synthetase family protein [Homoserinimonas sp.]
MAESTRLVDLVQESIDHFLVGQESPLATISSDLLPYLELSRSLLAGGKRFRALFCYWGWQAVTDPEGEASRTELPSVVDAASALEIFHAAALVHDDIIDNSDTRRGQPAAHRRFEKLHADESWRGDATEFGRSGALLLGDLLLGWSDELLDRGLRGLRDPELAAAARREFNRMRTEVTYGQYLDLLEERSWHTRAEGDLLSRAHRVIVYKSAKYSVEAPLTIGAAIGGASLGQLSALREFGLPLGIAYQLRDDLLGVFGDPEVTGKPSGDDLREGKRTVLVALARTKLPGNSARLLDELLGDPELSDHQVRVLQASIRESGAVDQVERIIAHNVERARSVLGDAPISPDARRQLTTLADTVSRRTA